MDFPDRTRRMTATSSIAFIKVIAHHKNDRKYDFNISKIYMNLYLLYKFSILLIEQANNYAGVLIILNIKKHFRYW